VDGSPAHASIVSSEIIRYANEADNVHRVGTFGVELPALPPTPLYPKPPAQACVGWAPRAHAFNPYLLTFKFFAPCKELPYHKSNSPTPCASANSLLSFY